MERPVGFTPAGARRIVQVVRRIEEEPEFDTGAQGIVGAGIEEQVQNWVQITSTSKTGDFYPGAWFLRSGSADTWTQQPQQIWVSSPNGMALEPDVYYRGLASGINAGYVVFDVIDGGAAGGNQLCQQTSTATNAQGNWTANVMAEYQSAGVVNYSATGVSVDVNDANGGILSAATLGQFLNVIPTSDTNSVTGNNISILAELRPGTTIFGADMGVDQCDTSDDTFTPNLTCDITHFDNTHLNGINCQLFSAYDCCTVRIYSIFSLITHILYVPLTTDVRDNYDAGILPGGGDVLDIPNRSASTRTRFDVMFVCRHHPVDSSAFDFKKLYLKREAPNAWPSKWL
jgi:hypothetical protein